MMFRPFVVSVAPALILMSACQSAITPSSQPADHVVLLDDSRSFGLRTNAVLRGKAALRVRAALLASGMQLGDRALIYRIGRRRTEEVLPEVLPLDRQHRPLAVANEVYRRIMAMGDDPTGGEDQTNILFPLQNGGFHCGPDGRGTVISITDGIEDSSTFADWRGLIVGKAQLPAPIGKPLLNCHVQMIGLGLTAEGTQQLSSGQIAALSAAHRLWTTNAGAADISISIGF
jgi:hypothetical protein